MTNVNILTVIILSAVATGCAHSSHIRGSVALVHSSTEADVCLGSNEVLPGDKVRLYKNTCKNLATVGLRESSKSACEKVYLGEGWVQRNLDEHYSTITSINNIALEEGMIVEKQ